MLTPSPTHRGRYAVDRTLPAGIGLRRLRRRDVASPLREQPRQLLGSTPSRYGSAPTAGERPFSRRAQACCFDEPQRPATCWPARVLATRRSVGGLACEAAARLSHLRIDGDRPLEGLPRLLTRAECLVGASQAIQGHRVLRRVLQDRGVDRCGVLRIMAAAASSRSRARSRREFAWHSAGVARPFMADRALLSAMVPAGSLVMARARR